MAQSGEIALGDAAKLIGCWNGMRKHFGPADMDGDDGEPMRRAVAFAKDIKASKLAAASFPVMVDRARQDETDERADLRVEAAHVDGTMGIHERNTHLAWLKEEHARRHAAGCSPTPAASPRASTSRRSTPCCS